MEIPLALDEGAKAALKVQKRLVGSRATVTARRIPIFHGFLGTAIFKSSVFYPAPQDAASMLANNGPCPSEGTSTEPIG